MPSDTHISGCLSVENDDNYFAVPADNDYDSINLVGLDVLPEFGKCK